MKRMWIAAGLLLAVAALCVGTLFFQLETVDRLEAELDAAAHAVAAGAADAEEKVASFAEDAKSAGDAVAFMARHADGHPLRESAALLPTLLAAGDRADFDTEVARCRFLLSELREAEKPLFGNIF